MINPPLGCKRRASVKYSAQCNSELNKNVYNYYYITYYIPAMPIAVRPLFHDMPTLLSLLEVSRYNCSLQAPHAETHFFQRNLLSSIFTKELASQ